MESWTINFYRHYGRWTVSAPFESRSDAERYSRENLETNACLDDITSVDVELPE